MKKFLPCLFVFAYTFSTAQTTWSEHVAPILYAHCTPCHHTGGIAPFSLMTYAEAFAAYPSIKSSVQNKRMPPWPPDPNYKHFVHERVLTTQEINTIVDWANSGAQQGNITQAPAQPTYSNTTQLGTVDLSVTIPTYTVSGAGDVYRNFPIPVTVPNGYYVTAFEVIPGTPQIVHHVLIFHDSTNVPAQHDAADPGPGYTNVGGTGSLASKLIGGYTPGASPYYTPVGTGFRLPTSTNIVIQVHYPAGSQGMTDATTVNFKLSPGPKRELTVWPLLNHLQSLTNGPLVIPANQTKTFNQQYNVSGNWTFLGAFPHMHLIGKSIKSWANTTVPNDTIRFVNIPNWDFHWQDTYVFPNAVKVPNGSTLRATAFYDNTSANPNNPSNPPQNVTAGEATTQEMMMVFFTYMPYQTGDENLIIDRRVIPKGATTFCNGQSVNLKTIEGTGYTYQWYRNGVLINGATSFQYAATQTGNYHVVITLGSNTANSDTIPVTVNTAPNAVVTPSGSTAICSGNSVTLNASTGNGYSYQWFKDGSPVSGATSSALAANTAGNYTVQIYNGCYAVSNTVTVTNATPPSAAITPLGATSFCPGGNVSLSAPAGLSYQWSSGGSLQTLVANASGTYTVTVTDANGCTNSSSINIAVFTPPSAVVTTDKPTTICPGDAVTLSAPAGLTYLWSNGSNAQSITVSQNGSFTITVTDANGCTAASGATTVTVSNNAVANVTSSGATTFCEGNAVTLTATSGTQYAWSNGATTQSITVNTTGTFTVTVTVGNNCTAVSVPETITVSSLPAVTLSGNQDAICVNALPLALTGGSPVGGSFSGTGISGSEFIPSVAGVGQHTITYTYTDANNCSNTATETIIVSDCTGLSDISGESVSVFPNPSNGKFEVIVASVEQNVTLKLFDMSGELIYAEALQHTHNVVELAWLAKGVYTIQIAGANSIYFGKVVIAH
ncbi:MAG: T9SS type A sorting domain-containing protein [Chitinophagales bacterium]|nr:T9SS type A sorting domain-containing protein [Chitinophagales bacterium]